MVALINHINMSRKLFSILIILCMITSEAALSQNKVTITNAGYNGNNTVELLARLDKDVLSKHPDVVVMMVGTNDMLNLRNMLTFEQYEEHYQQLITLIKKHAKLVMMTIPPVNSAYILQREDPKVYAAISPQGKVDSANVIIRKLAKKNKCKVIDLHGVLQACGGSTTDKESLFQNEANFNINDGVHPTVYGYRVIGTAVFQALSLMEPKATNIVCFGDSITFGYKMKGQGTVTGDSYPAVLNRLYNQ